ncbi:hypothetical protein [Candidatus Nitrotoga arctica]|uniref:hypothetical protein n=1 Tax=Candidatus Nitrotoga arctica TaxID=453162 RepID=UPI001EFA91A6|nr:hypothetical protein [Candidatus Nitrotoga arctica]
MAYRIEDGTRETLRAHPALRSTTAHRLQAAVPCPTHVQIDIAAGYVPPLLSCPPPFPIADATGPDGQAAIVCTVEAPQPQAVVQTMCSETARRTACSAARSWRAPRP